MNTNNFMNPRKDLIDGSINNVTNTPYDFNIEKASKQIDTNSVASEEFATLLAQYKAKVLERYAFLYKS